MPRELGRADRRAQSASMTKEATFHYGPERERFPAPGSPSASRGAGNRRRPVTRRQMTDAKSAVTAQGRARQVVGQVRHPAGAVGRGEAPAGLGYTGIDLQPLLDPCSARPASRCRSTPGPFELPLAVQLIGPQRVTTSSSPGRAGWKSASLEARPDRLRPSASMSSRPGPPGNIELVSVLVKRRATEGKLTREPTASSRISSTPSAEVPPATKPCALHGQRVPGERRGLPRYLRRRLHRYRPCSNRLLAAAKASGTRLILPSAGIGALDILSSGGRRRSRPASPSPCGKIRRRGKARSRRRWSISTRSTCRTPCSTARCARARGSIRRTSTISAAAAIAGIGLDRTRVVIVADPTITTHIVELEAKGAFGRFHLHGDVAVSEENRQDRASWSRWRW